MTRNLKVSLALVALAILAVAIATLSGDDEEPVTAGRDLCV